METIQKRQTAYKLWINDVVNAKMEKQEGNFGINYFSFNSNEISRVNLMAVIVAKNVVENYSSITLDDGSNTIRVKTWKEDVKFLDLLNIGDIVNVIGKVKNYSNENYIVPEIVKNVDHNFYLVRKYELLKIYGKPTEKISQVFEDKIEEIKIGNVSSSGRNKIIGVIEKLSDENGADINNVLSESKLKSDDFYNILNDLVKEGEVFMPKSDKIKLIG
ncbi:MAG TPA: OB-fold nucleic acid binding domain-containing protein [Candidatus Nanoarchaeia archaeon]|nr:OB-fold nucleic acid binding domain-containing protein [Candidatus Nanoarchaeia archaeon]